MPNLLLELGTEEIPARFLPKLENDLADIVTGELTANRIAFSAVKVMSTFRRIVIRGEGLADRQQDVSLEIKGPPAKVAYDAQGNPAKAAMGFAASQQVDMSALFLRDNYVYAQVNKKGDRTENVLPGIMLAVLQKLYLPIAMRWGYEQQQFIRPVHWILFLWDNRVLPFSFAGVMAGNTTRGHRIFSTRNEKGWAKDLEVPSIEAYEPLLEQENVIVDPAKRRSSIVESITVQGKKYGIEPMLEKEALISEVAYLTECPTVLVAEFAAHFLEIPEEVLITTMQKNQKYFPARVGGKLTNKYFIVAEHATESSKQNILEGNNRVLTARLEDARFFYTEDKKVPLAELVPKLKSIVYQEKLGTLYQKIERTQQLALWLNRNVFDLVNSEEVVKQATYLLKADLVTHMVYEFPELQGIMGKQYALFFGEPEIIADAIFEHYLPRFAGDILPETTLGMICAVADKLDSIVGCFSVGVIPTGSADPYALRRAAQGIVSILLHRKVGLNLAELIDYASTLFAGQNISAVQDFFLQRIRTTFIEQGYTYDIVDAVLGAERNVIPAIENRIKVLTLHKATPEFKEVVDTAVRVKRISANWTGTEVDEALLGEPEEIELNEKFKAFKLESGLAGNDHEALYHQARKFAPYVVRFFDKVLVMADDQRVKANRLSLLKAINAHYLRIADFEKIII